MSRILVIDDDRSFSREMTRTLSEDGFSCDVAFDGLSGLQMALENSYDLVLLDVMLPRSSGYQVCAQLRTRDVLVPILMLTAKSGEWDEAEGLDTGADDYLVKPVSMVVLKAHINALMRRSKLLPSRSITWCGLTLDRSLRTCCAGDVVIKLTGREVEVLAALLQAHGGTVSKDELVSIVWGAGDVSDVDPNIIVVYVKRLREKLEVSIGRKMIETIHGVGYRITEGV